VLAIFNNSVRNLKPLTIGSYNMASADHRSAICRWLADRSANNRTLGNGRCR
jgi:hypothetical protein